MFIIYVYFFQNTRLAWLTCGSLARLYLSFSWSLSDFQPISFFLCRHKAF